MQGNDEISQYGNRATGGGASKGSIPRGTGGPSIWGFFTGQCENKGSSLWEGASLLVTILASLQVEHLPGGEALLHRPHPRLLALPFRSGALCKLS